jgi:hypothetical protein
MNKFNRKKYRKKLRKILKETLLELDSLESMDVDRACERIKFLAFSCQKLNYRHEKF